MNENRNDTVQWLQYLLYAGIASAVHSLLANLSLLGSMSRWVGLAISAAAIYLLFRLADANPRYRNAAIFSAVSLVCAQIGGTILILACSVCGTVAQYQEYHAHGEMIEERNPKLAGKWHSLFWAQFVVGLLLSVLVSLTAAILAVIAGLETMALTAITTVVVSIISVILKVLYLVYLDRTVKTLQSEFVM